MSDEEIKRIFARNLKKYLEVNEKQPVDLVRDLKIPFSTVSNWINGVKLPRMGKVEMLADYFGIEKSDLLEDKTGVDDHYYLNDDTRELAQFLFDNPEYKVLFDGVRKAKKEDLEVIRALLDRFKD